MKEFYLDFFTKNENFPFHIMYDKHELSFPIHRHMDFSELVIVMSGTATHIVDNEMFPIKQGDVFVIGKETLHGYTNAVDFKICNIMFRFESFLSADYDIKKAPGFHTLFVLEPYLATIHGFANRLTLTPDDYIKVYDIIHAMMNEYSSDSDGRVTILQSYFMLLTVMLSRLCDIQGEENRRDIINVANTAAYIERHYTEKFTLDELAQMSHYSSRHFVRIFTETYHTTPQKYILSLRLRHACTMLRDSGMSVEDIALQSGFSDGNYFSRIFKKYMNMSPKQYRSNAKSNTLPKI